MGKEMDLSTLFSSDIFKWVILPLLIFFARLCDVSLGTLRIIFISRGIRYLAPLIGFFEVSIWLLAIGQIIQNLDNIICSVAYAAGFATGNFVGILIEERISFGLALLRIIIKHDASKIIDCFREAKYGVTTIDAEGIQGPVKIIFAVINRADIKQILKRIEKIHPHAFYTVEDVRSVGEAVLPTSKRKLFQYYRKGK